MFEKWRKGRTGRPTRLHLSDVDAHMLRDIGLNPDDFRDAFDDRRTSVLFNPFREPNRK